jgi:hypothetical protein
MSTYAVVVLVFQHRALACHPVIEPVCDNKNLHTIPVSRISRVHPSSSQCGIKKHLRTSPAFCASSANVRRQQSNHSDQRRLTSYRRRHTLVLFAMTIGVCCARALVVLRCQRTRGPIEWLLPATVQSVVEQTSRKFRTCANLMSIIGLRLRGHCSGEE